MRYDFTSILDRSKKDCLAVDLPLTNPASGPTAPLPGYSLIPMWVADMNFKTCPSITDAMTARIREGHFGYFLPSDEYYHAIIRWQSKRNGYTNLTSDEIGYENGVLGGVASAITAFTVPGESILLHSPTYIGFTHVIDDAGRKALLSNLYRDEEGIWRIDYEDMEKKLKENHIHLAILASPHNPTGRVWTKEELQKVVEICRKNRCILISDEIWSDLLMDGHRHTPTLLSCEEAAETVIAFYAPSKTFSLAGLTGSYHIVRNPYLRDRLESAGSRTHYNAINVLSMHALVGAYSDDGEQWVEELNEVLWGNILYACDFIKNHFPGVTFAVPEGTYMLYIDCEGYCKAAGITLDTLLKRGWDVGVAWQDGRPFHRPYAIRLNLALPFALVTEAFDRMEHHVFKEN